MNRLKSFYHVAKHSTPTFWELMSKSSFLYASPCPQSIINKKSHRICVCGDIETAPHLFFYCKFHDAARAILCNMVCKIFNLADNKLPEHFDCLNNVELLRLFLCGLPDDEPSHNSVAVFCAVDEFLKSCVRF